MKRYALLLSVLSAVVLSSAARCQETPSVGVLGLESPSLSAAEVDALTDRLRLELFRTGKFQVVERDQMAAIFDEMGFQANECMATECVVQAGEMIGAEYMVAGRITQVGTVLTITARMISVGQGTISRIAFRDCPCKIEEVLTRVLAEIAHELAGVGQPQQSVPRTTAVPQRRQIDPRDPARRVTGHTVQAEPEQERIDPSKYDDYICLIGYPLGFALGVMAPMRQSLHWGVEASYSRYSEERLDFASLLTVLNFVSSRNMLSAGYIQLSFGATYIREEDSYGERTDSSLFPMAGLGVGIRYHNFGVLVRFPSPPWANLTIHF